MSREGIVSELAESIIADIRRQLRSGKLKNGDPISSERELCERHGVSRSTLRRALRLIEERGLITRIQGRGTFVRIEGLRNDGKGGMLGLILQAEGTSYLLERDIMVGTQRQAESLGYHITLGFAHHSGKREVELATRFHDQTSGIIVWSCGAPDALKLFHSYHDHGFPVVYIDRLWRPFSIPFVGSDNFGGGFQATNHLIELGHQRIGFVHLADLVVSSLRDRFYGYLTALSEHDLVPGPKLAIQDDDDRIRAYLEADNRPTAVFCENDGIALRVATIATKLGLRVGQDLSVVGFDDIHQGVAPFLTTVAQNGVEIGKSAVNLLVAQIEGRLDARIIDIVPTHLIVRESTGQPRRSTSTSLSGTQAGLKGGRSPGSWSQ